MPILDDYKNDIGIDLEISGSACSLALEDALGRAFDEEGFKAHVRILQGPAAGPEAVIQLVVDFFHNTPEDIRALAIKAILAVITRKLNSFANASGALACLAINGRSYDLVIKSQGGEFLTIDNDEIARIASRTKEFAEQNNNNIRRIELPCELVCNEDGRILEIGIGSTDLWFVQYKEWGQYGPVVVYDAANDCYETDFELHYPS